MSDWRVASFRGKSKYFSSENELFGDVEWLRLLMILGVWECAQLVRYCVKLETPLWLMQSKKKNSLWCNNDSKSVLQECCYSSYCSLHGKNPARIIYTILNPIDWICIWHECTTAAAFIRKISVAVSARLELLTGASNVIIAGW